MGPGEIQNHHPAGAVLLGEGEEGVDLAPVCEGRVIKRTQHGPMPYVCGDIVCCIVGVSFGRCMVVSGGEGMGPL